MEQWQSSGELEVEIGACAVTIGDFDLVLPHLTTGLALCLYDGHDVAGVAYALRGLSTPDERSVEMRPGLFVDLAIPELLRMMDERGARRERFGALVGAAAGVGWRRAREMAGEAADVGRTLLRKLQIPIAHEVLGGSMSRAVRVSGLGLVRIDTAREAGRVLRIAAPPPLTSSPQPGPSSSPSPAGDPPRGP
jgi:chemotaxis receptor (MCP) glutamine deamidase CheD